MENGTGKHQLTNDESCGDSPAKISTKDADDKLLKHFLTWCENSKFDITDKVKISKEGACAQYGMVAVDDLEEGAVLFKIPRPSLLYPNTCGIAELLQNEAGDLQSSSGWVPLLLALMFEYNNPQSKWRPYLDLIPDFKELDLPMFWSLSDRENLLCGTGVQEAVDHDMTNLTKEFNTCVLPFVRKHQQVFSAACQDIEFYKKMVAFVMAYSFTEPANEDVDEEDVDGVTSPPMMVPVADILNHIAKNNARLAFEKDCLKMVTLRKIHKGEEIFNTYGQVSNCHLLHMYGFAEEHPNNHYETVDIPMKMVFEAAKSLHFNTDSLLEEKWQFLQAMDLSSDDVFVVGVDGILTEDEMYNTLKVLVMTEEKFKAHKEKEGWSDADSDTSEDESLGFDKMASLPDDWKLVLASCAKASLTRYKTSLAEDEETVSSGQLSQVASRKRFSFHTCYSQKKLLQKIIESCR
ncbi:N-lysine methyltransferase setd6-like [Gigantopelta aegis]|uniref:N-lysine methyltransferase setd6-like n=1 Tax=Gigantopelta aegis TaxID=1735272 RepID=UPI001B88ACE4|nr:N-lysine methyltransferase setd6-like [Gigantopelta aegis]